MANDLTPRQQEILDFIRNSMEVFSMPPTRAEIAGAFGFASPNAAEDHLRALAKKGAITLEPGSARGIRLVEQLGLPLIGTVAAGSPLLAVENRLGNIRLDPALFTAAGRFPAARARPVDDRGRDTRRRPARRASHLRGQQRPDRHRAAGR
jgi:repressor LexA